MGNQQGVHLVQLDIAWEDKDASRARAERLLDGAPVEPGDLVVLPEMCETGFSMNTERTADRDGSSARWLASLATRHRAWVIGGITVDAPNDRARNRALAIDPDGVIVERYDKIHPFSFGKEAESFEGGTRVARFEWKGAHDDGLVVCPVVCYDLRFPELFRAGRAMGAECFVVIANWPAERAEHWRALLRARAIENQAFVVGVNRAGDDPYLAYAGGSVVFGPRGETLVDAGTDAGVASAALDPGAARAWRSSFRAWEDAKVALLPRIGEGGDLVEGEAGQAPASPGQGG
ncbi:MAG: hypothetical protein KF684_12120 [Phycisphaeraceae bacterium]|nr:hypothetical protein [Phycisphaeraceae bacterium]